MSIVIGNKEGNWGIINARSSDVTVPVKRGGHSDCEICDKRDTYCLKGQVSVCYRPTTKEIDVFYSWWRSDPDYCVREDHPHTNKEEALKDAEENYRESLRHWEPVEGLSKDITYYMVMLDQRTDCCYCAGIKDDMGYIPNTPNYVSAGGCSFSVHNNKYCEKGDRKYLLPGHMGLTYHGLCRKMQEGGYKIISADSMHELPEGLVEKFSETEREEMLKICPQIQFEFEGIQERAYLPGWKNIPQAEKLRGMGFVLSAQWCGKKFDETTGVWERVKNKTLKPRYRTAV